jgi:hypothetical protein
MIAVLKPNWAQRIAATYPPGPEPIMTTSNELIVLILGVFLFMCRKITNVFWYFEWQTVFLKSNPISYVFIHQN